MTFGKLWVIAYRDLGRNRRRTILTLMAVAMGLAIIIIMSGFIAGAMENSLQDNIRLNTAHLQLRGDSYEEERLSLLWDDLVEDPYVLATQAEAMAEVTAASPVLWASGVLNTIQQSAGLKVIGIDPDSTLHDPVRTGLVAGDYLTPAGRGEILLGRRLAEEMEIGVGQRVSVAVGNPDGRPEEGTFTVVGLFDTGIPSYDQNTLFMSLAQAQSFTRAGNRASAVKIMLERQDDADAVATALDSEGISALTWEALNIILLQTVETGMSFYIILYAIVILVVAVVIANTLLMAVFERTREMGILAALGMKGRQIMLMFILEAAILALIGIAVGVALGSAGVAYLAQVGIPLGDASASMVESIAFGTTMYARFAPGTMAALSLAMLVVILLASLYPARFAARMEPIEALHSL